MIFCLVNIVRLKRLEFRPTQKVFQYSIRLNPKTQLMNARWSIANTIMQLKSLDRKFVFRVYGDNGKLLYQFDSE